MIMALTMKMPLHGGQLCLTAMKTPLHRGQTVMLNRDEIVRKRQRLREENAQLQARLQFEMEAFRQSLAASAEPSAVVSEQPSVAESAQPSVPATVVDDAAAAVSRRRLLTAFGIVGSTLAAAAYTERGREILTDGLRGLPFDESAEAALQSFCDGKQSVGVCAARAQLSSAEAKPP
jgi:hypothetical protein